MRAVVLGAALLVGAAFAALAPAARAQQHAPVTDPAAGLVGQTTALCHGPDVVFAATVQRADWLPQVARPPLVILALDVADRGDGSTHVYPGGRLTDERGRMFDMVAPRGADLDYAGLARQYGGESLSWYSVQSELTPRLVWVFTVSADVQTLRIAQDPLNRCN